MVFVIKSTNFLSQPRIRKHCRSITHGAYGTSVTHRASGAHETLKLIQLKHNHEYKDSKRLLSLFTGLVLSTVYGI